MNNRNRSRPIPAHSTPHTFFYFLYWICFFKTSQRMWAGWPVPVVSRRSCRPPHPIAREANTRWSPLLCRSTTSRTVWGVAGVTGTARCTAPRSSSRTSGTPTSWRAGTPPSSYRSLYQVNSALGITTIISYNVFISWSLNDVGLTTFPSVFRHLSKCIGENIGEIMELDP